MALIQYLARIQFDFGAIALLKSELDRLGIKRPLLITDKGIVDAGIADIALNAAQSADMLVYDETTENPNEASLLKCMELWSSTKRDGVIALGGGSAIDLSKAVALLATHGGNFADYDVLTCGSEGIGRVAPQVCIPTAAGTGAEVGRACVMTLLDGRKSVAVNLNMVADTVICDPDLTVSLPPALTAATGIDALSHGVEALMSNLENPPAAAIAVDCIRRASRWLEVAVADGKNRQARWEMMMAALEGGMCLQKSLGAAHAMATPLGELHLHHGTLIGILLPHVVKFNTPAAPEAIAQIREAAGIAPEIATEVWFDQLVRRLGLPTRLSQLGISAKDLRSIAEKAMNVHLTKTNPRAPQMGDYLRLLKDAM